VLGQRLLCDAVQRPGWSVRTAGTGWVGGASDRNAEVKSSGRSGTHSKSTVSSHSSSTGRSCAMGGSGGSGGSVADTQA
jgi:hypothetical protein